MLKTLFDSVRNFKTTAYTLIVTLVITFSIQAETSAQKFSKGISFPGQIPKVIIRASGKSNKLYIPPSQRRLNKQATATITVTYTGFTDEQRAAFDYAKSIWEKTITSAVPIKINAKWENLGNGILGQCGASDWKYNFTGAPMTNTYYPLALAEALAGQDLNSGASDIETSYNTLYAADYYYGTDGNCPAGKTDYVSVVIHEICHGLGFSALSVYEGGVGYFGGKTAYPSMFGQHMVNSTGNKMVDTYTSGSYELGTFFTSGDVWWKGTNTGTVQLYAPSTYSGGSSISHMNETYNNTNDSLMTYSIDTGSANHSLGTVVPNMFKDMGWTVDTSTDSGDDGDTGGTTETPTITLSKTSLTVECSKGQDATSQTFKVSNSGKGTLSYAITSDVSWLSCSPSTGTETASLKSALFSKGVSFPGIIPQIQYIASDKPNKRFVPPSKTYQTWKTSNKQANATITVNYTGFNTEQKAAFQKAVDIWTAEISSTVTITIDAEWKSLGGNILAQCGATDYKTDFTGAPKSNTFYCIALAEALAGSDLNNGQAEIEATFNTDYTDYYYYGADGNCPADKYDFVSTVIHELCHGLGFLGTMQYTSGQGQWGAGYNIPMIFDHNIYNGNSQLLINTSNFANPSSDLGSQLVSDNLYFVGQNAGNVKLYAPTTWSGGSSVYHVAESYNGTTNSLMTYSGDPGDSQWNVGSVVQNVFKDIGWTLGSGGGGGDTGTGDTITVTFDTSGLAAGTYTGTITVADANASNNPQTVSVTLTVIGGAYNVSIGSIFEVDATSCAEASISEFDKKPKVYAYCNGKKKVVKVLTKGYPCNTIECEWKQKVTADKYSLYVQPKTKGYKYTAEEVSDDFNVEDPSISALVDNGTSISISGSYFGTKKPKVYVLYTATNGKTKKMKFKVTSYTMNTSDGTSTITATKHKKITSITEGNLVIENKIGYDSVAIIITTLKGSQSKVVKIRTN